MIWRKPTKIHRKKIPIGDLHIVEEVNIVKRGDYVICTKASLGGGGEEEYNMATTRFSGSEEDEVAELIADNPYAQTRFN